MFVRRFLSFLPRTSPELASMLRVDHAGEFAAVAIYRGQMAVLGKKHEELLKEMQSHEQAHLDKVSALLVQKRVRPTILLPIWNIAGYSLGAVSALLGPESAMACTVAVEEAISEHYNDQLRTIAKDEEMNKEHEVKEMIQKNRDDEILHLNIALDNNAKKAPLFSILSTTIKIGCRTAIWLSKKI